MRTTMDTIETMTDAGNPVASVVFSISIHKKIHVYETKTVRASSFNETASTTKNSKYGLVNIPNDDPKCVKWFMLDWNNKRKNYKRLAVLNKVNDKCSYAYVYKTKKKC